MKIESITPTMMNYIATEEDLEKIESVFIKPDSVTNQNQKCYKIRCIPKDSKFKVGERVVISMRPTIELLKVNDIMYMVLKEHDILGVLKD